MGILLIERLVGSSASNFMTAEIAVMLESEVLVYEVNEMKSLYALESL